MNKYLKIFLIISGFGLIIGLATVYYIFHMPHRNLANEKPAFTLSADKLLSEYQADESKSNKKYLDKAIEISGKVADISNDKGHLTVILNDKSNAVSCGIDSLTFVDNKKNYDSIKVGKQVTLRGKCDGYDMILGVVLTSAVIVDQKL